MRWLDEHGYVWYYSNPSAVPHEAVTPAATVKASDLIGKDAAAVLSRVLAGVQPSGTKLPWVENAE